MNALFSARNYQHHSHSLFLYKENIFTISNRTATLLIGGPPNIYRFLDIVNIFVKSICMAFMGSVISGFWPFAHLKLSLIIEQMI